MAPLPDNPRLGFFVSHRGSNMRAVVSACDQKTLMATPALLISNNRNSAALAWAAEHDLPHVHLSAKTEGSEVSLDSAHISALKEARVDLIILAGYMRKIGPQVLAAYKNRIVNIHPALLPKYGGQGMYGGNVHKAVIAAGERESGVTVHLVDGDYDTGPIIDQVKVPVHANDSAEDLAERVLAEEHKFLASTLARVVAGDIDLDALR